MGFSLVTDGMSTSASASSMVPLVRFLPHIHRMHLQMPYCTSADMNSILMPLKISNAKFVPVHPTHNTRVS